MPRTLRMILERKPTFGAPRGLYGFGGVYSITGFGFGGNLPAMRCGPVVPPIGS